MPVVGIKLVFTPTCINVWNTNNADNPQRDILSIDRLGLYNF